MHAFDLRSRSSCEVAFWTTLRFKTHNSDISVPLLSCRKSHRLGLHKRTLDIQSEHLPIDRRFSRGIPNVRGHLLHGLRSCRGGLMPPRVTYLDSFANSLSDGLTMPSRFSLGAFLSDLRRSRAGVQTRRAKENETMLCRPHLTSRLTC